MAEFCKEDFTVYLAGPDGTWKIYTLAQLLPYSFSLETE
jgi:cytidine deaminase